eukprot:3878641-Pyramimonas_sp.AAC.1
MDLVVTGAAIGMPTNLKNPSDHVPVMVTIAPETRASDGPPPIPGWALATEEYTGCLDRLIAGIDRSLPIRLQLARAK